MQKSRPIEICSTCTHTHTHRLQFQFCGLVSSLLLPLCLSVCPSNRHRLFFPVRAFLSDWSRTWSQDSLLLFDADCNTAEVLKQVFWNIPNRQFPPHTMVSGEHVCEDLILFSFSFLCYRAYRRWLIYSGRQGGNMDLCGVCIADIWN